MVGARFVTVRIFITVTLLSLLCACGVAQQERLRPSQRQYDTQYSGYADYIRARFFVADGKVDKALAALAKTQESDSDSVYIRAARAALYLEQGKLGVAYRLLTEALDLRPDDTDSRLLLADLLYTRNNDGDQVRALVMLHRVLADNPQMDELYIYLSQLHLLDDDNIQAMATIKRLLKRQPDNIQALLLQAKIYILFDEKIKAEKIFRHVITLCPQGRRAYVYLGKLLEQNKQLDAALLLYKQAAYRSVDNAYFGHLRASLLINNQQYSVALQELQQLVKNDPADYEALNKISLIYLRQHNWFLAEQTLLRSLTIEPLSQQFYWLGYALEQQDKFDAAADAYTKVTKPQYLYAQAVERLAIVYAKHGKFALAASTVEHLIAQQSAIAEQKQPTTSTNLRPALFLQLALYYEYQQQGEDVLSAFKRGLARFPNSIELNYAQGVYYSEHGSYLLMEQSMRRVIKLDKKHAGALNYMAYTFAENGERLDEALDFAKRAVAVKANGAYQDTLGWVYFKLGEYTQAREQLELAVAELPDDMVVQEHLGDIYAALGLDNKAAEIYTQILKKTPDNKLLKEKLGDLK
ncbi:MAG: hypothetical protein B6I36_06925 [Desulfobacteraceae bacterium 4572_35.1]|nr:MAG: hypothetical protein B6I36_06925 [Desulfobacteraceae bacterium 4572_35.1]